jgi:hypothetical protein
MLAKIVGRERVSNEKSIAERVITLNIDYKLS